MRNEKAAIRRAREQAERKVAMEEARKRAEILRETVQEPMWAREVEPLKGYTDVFGGEGVVGKVMMFRVRRRTGYGYSEGPIPTWTEVLTSVKESRLGSLKAESGVAVGDVEGWMKDVTILDLSFKQHPMPSLADPPNVLRNLPAPRPRAPPPPPPQPRVQASPIPQAKHPGMFEKFDLETVGKKV
ncbi:hypothetical protein HDV00_001032 [Rhizophlyctis rosea]|nr:hypothetical protein HDV00_001032 [Rhizophlyctis rosea]